MSDAIHIIVLHIAPPRGVYANPITPYCIWMGVCTPQATEPALVEITADPSAATVWPSRLTPSLVPGVSNPLYTLEYLP